MSLIVVRAGPFVPCSWIAASTMRRRVSAWLSARFFSSYLRFTTQQCITKVDSRAESMNESLHSYVQSNIRGEPVDKRIDQIAGGIYRISSWNPDYGITFNQYLIDDERPTLVHTGNYDQYEAIRGAIREVLDPARLAHVVLLHWEGDENGGMDRFMAEAPEAELVGSALSIGLNASGFGLTERVRGFTDGETLELGRHTLRFLETPHVHHWDSMMVVEESTRSLFPSDLFIQPGDQPPVVEQDLGAEMCAFYRE